jgi:hypothetical protein
MADAQDLKSYRCRFHKVSPHCLKRDSNRSAIGPNSLLACQRWMRFEKTKVAQKVAQIPFDPRK